MKTFRTSIYENNVLQHQEKLMTLREFIELDRLRVGQQLYLVEINQTWITSGECVTIGDATVYHEPSDNDCGIGWSDDNPQMNKYVLEVHNNPCVFHELESSI